MIPERFMNCLVCQKDISSKQLGTKLCSDECRFVFRKRYLQNYFQTNKERLKEYGHEWRKNNPKKRAAQQRRYQLKKKIAYAEIKRHFRDNPPV